MFNKKRNWLTSSKKKNKKKNNFILVNPFSLFPTCICIFYGCDHKDLMPCFFT